MASLECAKKDEKRDSNHSTADVIRQRWKVTCGAATATASGSAVRRATIRVDITRWRGRIVVGIATEVGTITARAGLPDCRPIKSGGGSAAARSALGAGAAIGSIIGTPLAVAIAPTLGGFGCPINGGSGTAAPESVTGAGLAIGLIVGTALAIA